MADDDGMRDGAASVETATIIELATPGEPMVYRDDDAIIKTYIGCPRCRHEVVPEYAWCPYCGKKLRW